MSTKAEHDGGEVVLYRSPEGDVHLEVRLDRDSVWLTQRQMAELLDTSTDNIGLHLRHVYREGELDEAATTEQSSVVRVEGRRRVRRSVRHYNLEAAGACPSEDCGGAPGYLRPPSSRTASGRT